MPRHAIYVPDEDENVHVDLCADCWPPDAEDLADVTDLDYLICEESLENEDMEDGCEHPPYEHEEYECWICGKVLSRTDN